MADTAITIQRNALLPALAAATKAVERRTTIPILQNVLIETGDGAVTITGFDLDIEVSQTVAAKCDAGTAFTLPGGMLHDTVKKLPDGAEITIALDAHNALVSSGRSRFTLQTLPAGDYPRIGTMTPDVSFQLDAKLLDRLIATLQFAISTEETRFYLNGIYLHPEDENMVAVATDGHRLAKMAIDLPEGARDMPSVIVPRKTVGVLRALLADGEVEIGLSQSLIRVSREGAATMTSKLIDGVYPDYQRVVPVGNANHFRADRAALEKAIDRVTTIRSERGSAVKFVFGEALALSVNSPDAGRAEDELPLETVAGAPVEIGFNGKYCLEMLSAAGGSRIEAQLEGGAPAIFLPVDGPEPRPLFVIMPMRV